MSVTPRPLPNPPILSPLQGAREALGADVRQRYASPLRIGRTYLGLLCAASLGMTRTQRPMLKIQWLVKPSQGARPFKATETCMLDRRGLETGMGDMVQLLSQLLTESGHADKVEEWFSMETRQFKSEFLDALEEDPHALRNLIVGTWWQLSDRPTRQPVPGLQFRIRIVEGPYQAPPDAESYTSDGGEMDAPLTDTGD